MNLAPSADNPTVWRYFLQNEAFVRSTGPFIQPLVQPGNVKQWSNDVPRTWGLLIPYSELQSYSFYMRIFGTTSAYEGVFFRGGNVVRTCARLHVLDCGT